MRYRIERETDRAILEDNVPHDLDLARAAARRQARAYGCTVVIVLIVEAHAPAVDVETPES